MIPHSRPLLPEDPAEVAARLAPGWVAGGPCVAAFERAAAAVMGCADGVAVASGTTALTLVLRALGVGPGDEVVLPSYVCSAVLSAVHQVGATAVLADSEPGGANLDPDDARRKLTRRTRAVIAAHLFGQPARLEDLLALGPPVIEDCAQSFGGQVDGRPLGARGAAAIASFYATKVITTGCGGLACSRDPALQARLRDLTAYDEREEYEPRFSCRMSELDAALGLWQLERLPAMLARRREIAARYRAAWSGLGVTFPEFPEGTFPYRFTFRVPDGARVMERLRAAGIGARAPVFRPLHRYPGVVPDPERFPHADRAHREIVSVPCYPALTEPEVVRVIETVARVLEAR